jgi:hypothetical protein
MTNRGSSLLNKDNASQIRLVRERIRNVLRSGWTVWTMYSKLLHELACSWAMLGYGRVLGIR